MEYTLLVKTDDGFGSLYKISKDHKSILTKINKKSYLFYNDEIQIQSPRNTRFKGEDEEMDFVNRFRSGRFGEGVTFVTSGFQMETNSDYQIFIGQ